MGWRTLGLRNVILSQLQFHIFSSRRVVAVLVAVFSKLHSLIFSKDERFRRVRRFFTFFGNECLRSLKCPASIRIRYI